MPENNFSLVDFKGAADVINNVINKVSSAIGWSIIHDTPSRIAQKAYINDIMKLDLDPLMKAALISNAKKIIREYTNQHNTLAIAMNNIADSKHIKDVGDDWICYFMDSVKDISNEEFQKLWALIFAKECTLPGSIPKSLLFTLQKMDQSDAELFMRFCMVLS